MRPPPPVYSREAVFEAICDPTRRAVLDLLQGGDRPAGQIAAAFPVSRPAISKHLRTLRRARLVQESRQGRHRIYRLNPQPLRLVDGWLDGYRAFWRDTLTDLKNFVESGRTPQPAGKSSGSRKPRKKEE